jgi:hypothetical protein
MQATVVLEILLCREMLLDFSMLSCAQLLKACADNRHLNLWHEERN